MKNLQDQLSQANKENQGKQKQIDELAGKVQAIEERDQNKAYKAQLIKGRVQFFWDILWKVLCVVAIVVGTLLFCKATGADFGTWLSIVIGVLGLAGSGIAIFKHDLKKYRERCAKAVNLDTR